MRRQIQGLRLGLFAALGYLPVLGLGGCGDGDSATSTGGRSASGGREPGAGGTTGGEPQNTGGVTGGRDQGESGAGGQGGEPTAGCENPRPWSGDPTGTIVSCGTWKHRPEAVACPSAVPRSVRIAEQPRGSLGGGGDSGEGRCDFDADCPESEVCALNSWGYAYCYETCVTDSDCRDGSICECGSGAGVCREATCRTDSDCAGDALCAAQFIESTYACQHPNDECMVDEDCGEGSMGDAMICVATSSGRVCSDPPVPGRPFLVAGEARVAGVCARADWRLRNGSPALARLSDADRQKLAAEWTRTAQMEHASIAAFARFSLELLAFGAPAELVAEAARAQADETAHAMAAFELASAYAARPLGPEPLAVSGVLTAPTLEESALTTFLEGCVGESVAALEAALARDLATDPGVKAVLERIALDEARHAELAFKFVRFALERVGTPLAARLRSALAREIERAQAAASTADAGGGDGSSLAAHGILPDSERRAARVAALREVVAPCVATLLTETKRSAAITRGAELA